MKYIDLHVHSCFSDGTMHIDEILERAIKNNVVWLAIADHNQLSGTKALLKAARTSKVNIIPAVELDAIHFGKDVHILAYDFDVEDKVFNDFVIENRYKLDYMSVQLIEKMSVLPEGEKLSVEDFKAFEHDACMGGWKALHYLVERGVTNTIYEGMPLYEAYDCHYDGAGFLSVKEVCQLIHNAGGIAVLAHPGVTFNEDEIESSFNVMLQNGIDGIECYYPKHSADTVNAATAFCRQHALYITSGSDCHGTFGKTDIGDPKTDIANVSLWRR